MKRLTMIAAAMMCVSAASAVELTGISIGAIRTSAQVPMPVLGQDGPAKCGHVSGELTKLHLMAQTSKSQLVSYSETEAQFDEFKALWRPILEKFGMKVTGTEYAGSLGIMKYESPDGRVVRDFMADKLQYNAMDQAEVAKLQHALLEPLEQAGMTPIASFTVKNDIVRPTFRIYYLTAPRENMDREVQLRQLINDSSDDVDLIAGAVKLVKKDADFSTVYIGRLVGYKSRLATDEAGVQAKLAEYRKFLAENGKDFIASKVYKLDKPIEHSGEKFNYFASVYFFQ